jgi:hypothetical protein
MPPEMIIGMVSLLLVWLKSTVKNAESKKKLEATMWRVGDFIDANFPREKKKARRR